MFGYFCPTREFTHGEVTITGEGQQILIDTQNSWSLSSEGSLACYKYCDTGHNLRGLETTTPKLLTVEQSLPALYSGLLRPKFEHPTFILEPTEPPPWLGQSLMRCD